MTSFWRAQKNKSAIKNAEKTGLIADSMSVRLELMKRVKDGVITLTRAQAELKIIKDNATQNGKITRSQACR